MSKIFKKVVGVCGDCPNCFKKDASKYMYDTNLCKSMDFKIVYACKELKIEIDNKDAGVLAECPLEDHTEEDSTSTQESNYLF